MLHFDRLIHFGRKIKLFAAKGPAYHYIYGRWRLRRWLNRNRVEAGIPDDRTFFAQLHLEKPELAPVKKAVTAGNYAEARAQILAYFQTRATPRFFFEPADREQYLALIDNQQQEATLCAADEICQNIFRFRRVPPVTFADGIDWAYRPHGNIDWTWDLNRHAYFETLGRAYWYTGEERYAQKFRELLLDWLAKNPAGVSQLSWDSVLEVAIRLNPWLWAFHYFRLAAAFDQQTCLALLNGLLAHGRYLETYLEFHTRNNHLLFEAKSMAMLGLLFPEFKQAHKWRQQGLEILYRQIEAQVCADGVHGERASHYHRAISSELLELLVLLENNDVPIPPEIRATFGRMVEFELWLTKPNGLLPLLADSALEDTHMRFSATSGGPAFLGRHDLKPLAPALTEANIWLLGPRRVGQYLAPTPPAAQPAGSRAFPQGGYFIMRAGHGPEAAYLTFDCGPFGYPLEPYHGHADALSFELHALGQTLLVDPGMYSAHLGHDWRLFFRGSRAHNTVVVDGQDQSMLLDSRRVYRQAEVTLHHWLSSDHFDFVDGSHNGYERFAEPVRHRRQIFFAKPEYWLVIDWLTGQGRHCFDLYFHLMPGAAPHVRHQANNTLYTGNGLEPGLAIVPLDGHNLQTDIITGATGPIQGWVSFFSGEKLPAPTVRYRHQGTAPVQFCTLLYPYPAGATPSLNITPLKVEIEGSPAADAVKRTALCIETDRHIDYLLIDQETGGTGKVFAGYQTDAWLLYARHQKKGDAPVKVVMRGGRRLIFQGQALLEGNSLGGDFSLDYER